MTLSQRMHGSKTHRSWFDPSCLDCLKQHGINGIISHLEECEKSLADNAYNSITFLTDKAPNLDEKIKFNGLTDPVSAKLKVLGYQVSLIDDFLDASDAGLRQAIAQELRDYYQQSKVEIPNGLQDAGNRRYFWLLEKLKPPTVTHPHSLGVYIAAAELVIAKYFETCDAYDHPASPATT